MTFPLPSSNFSRSPSSSPSSPLFLFFFSFVFLSIPLLFFSPARNSSLPPVFLPSAPTTPSRLATPPQAIAATTQTRATKLPRASPSPRCFLRRCHQLLLLLTPRPPPSSHSRPITVGPITLGIPIPAISITCKSNFIINCTSVHGSIRNHTTVTIKNNNHRYSKLTISNYQFIFTAPPSLSIPASPDRQSLGLPLCPSITTALLRPYLHLGLSL